MIRATGDPELDRLLGDPRVAEHVALAIRYGQTRALEIVLALIMLAFGIVLLIPEPTFTAASYRVVAAFVTERQAGTVALAVGAVRLYALWLNGQYRHTPIPRTLGCLGGFAFWSALSLGFALAVPPLSTGLAVYPVLAAAELYSSRRAAGDAFVLDSFGLRLAARRRAEVVRQGAVRDGRAA